jgi:hypothetical protein
MADKRPLDDSLTDKPSKKTKQDLSDIEIGTKLLWSEVDQFLLDSQRKVFTTVVNNEHLHFVDLMTLYRKPIYRNHKSLFFARYGTEEARLAFINKSAAHPEFDAALAFYVDTFGSEDFHRFKHEIKSSKTDILMSLSPIGMQYLYFLMRRADISTEKGYANDEWELPTEADLKIIDDVIGQKIHKGNHMIFNKIVNDLKLRLLHIVIEKIQL